MQQCTISMVVQAHITIMQHILSSSSTLTRHKSKARKGKAGAQTPWCKVAHARSTSLPSCLYAPVLHRAQYTFQLKLGKVSVQSTECLCWSSPATTAATVIRHASPSCSNTYHPWGMEDKHPLHSTCTALGGKAIMAQVEA